MRSTKSLTIIEASVPRRFITFIDRRMVKDGTYFYLLLPLLLAFILLLCLVFIFHGSYSSMSLFLRTFPETEHSI